MLQPMNIASPQVFPPIPIRYSYTGEPKILVPKDIESSTESSIFLQVQKKIEYLKNIYIFDNHNEIISFLLDNNEDLLDILWEASNYIFDIFGKVPIYLDLHHDPEEGWDELFIVIKTHYSPEKALELENKLFEEWFIKVIDKVKGRLNFTEEPL